MVYEGRPKNVSPPYEGPTIQLDMSPERRQSLADLAESTAAGVHHFSDVPLGGKPGRKVQRTSSVGFEKTLCAYLDRHQAQVEEDIGKVLGFSLSTGRTVLHVDFRTDGAAYRESYACPTWALTNPELLSERVQEHLEGKGLTYVQESP